MIRHLISEDTVLICSKVLERYLDVLMEHPAAVAPEFREWIASAFSELRRARLEMLLKLRGELAAVPTETDEASLLCYLNNYPGPLPKKAADPARPE